MRTKRQKHVYREFARRYERFGEQAADWYDLDFYLIRVEIDDGRVGEYDGLEKTFEIANSVEELELRHNGDTEDKWKLEFSIRLNREMRRVGIDQNELAELTGLNQGSISRYLNGVTMPNGFVLKNIANALESDLNYLINF